MTLASLVIVSFSNHRPCPRKYRVSRKTRWSCGDGVDTVMLAPSGQECFINIETLNKLHQLAWYFFVNTCISVQYVYSLGNTTLVSFAL